MKIQCDEDIKTFNYKLKEESFFTTVFTWLIGNITPINAGQVGRAFYKQLLSEEQLKRTCLSGTDLKIGLKNYPKYEDLLKGKYYLNLKGDGLDATFDRGGRPCLRLWIDFQDFDNNQ